MSRHRHHGRIHSSQHAQHVFSLAPQANIPRSSFNRSHGLKTTFDEGYLIPILVDEVLPGDTFNLKMTGFARLATPIYPIMDNMYMETFFFFVPCRLLWDNWERFNGQQDDPDSSTEYVMPVLDTTSFTVTTGSLADYFGLPLGEYNSGSSDPISLPFRAYNLIWNTWFRDENMQDSLPVSKLDTDDDPAVYTVQRRGKRYDYFTSCLPWPQKINDGTVVEIPLGTSAPVIANPTSPVPVLTNGTDNLNFQSVFGQPQAAWSAIPAAAGSVDMQWAGISTGLITDLTSATAATINQLRQAFQLQKLYERDARGGTRYTEIVKSHFGVISADSRLQRPEYLGGGSSMININPVAQTSPPTGTDSTPPGVNDTPQGNLAAFGTCGIHHHGFVKSFTEHGYIIGLLSTRADLNYQQGINRMWNREIRWDFYWPALSHIGEQAVLNREIYFQNTTPGPTSDIGTFGYQERFAEYRYKPSLITGLFRSDATDSLDAWHLAQDFGALPELNEDFIVENAPVDRVIAVPSEPHFILDVHYDYLCVRPMPLYGVPGLIDHF